MKNLLSLCVLALLIIGGMSTNAQQNTQEDNNATTGDSTIGVVGYFSTNDTLVYWINQSSWRLEPTDTIKTAGVSTKVRVTVVDSTSRGYKMDYTFLDFRGDSVAESSLGEFQNKLIEKLGKKIIGTTIRFETDELGTITKFNNLGQIRRQAKSLFKEAMKELMQMPEIAGLKKEFNIDIKAMVKDLDSDLLVDGYLEELKMLFWCHGLEFNLGETHIHEDATDTTYENDTYTIVQLDTTDYTYSLATSVVSIIPQAALKDIVGGFVCLMENDSISESFNSEFDKQVKTDAIYESYFSSDYIARGWPYKVVKQSTMTIDGRGKSRQAYIYLDYIND